MVALLLLRGKGMTRVDVMAPDSERIICWILFCSDAYNWQSALYKLHMRGMI